MWNRFLTIFITALFCLLPATTSLRASGEEMLGLNGVPLFVDDLSMELWYGTELDLFYRSGLRRLDADLFAQNPLLNPAITENAGFSQSFLNSSAIGGEAESANHPAPATAGDVDGMRNQQRRHVADFAHLEKQVAFADSPAVDIWNVAKWTIVVLVIAVLGVLAARLKSNRPLLNNLTQELQHQETLSLGQRGSLYLIRLAGERYLVATDVGGVKSVTLVPNWNAEAAQDDDLTPEDETTMRSKTLSVAEAR